MSQSQSGTLTQVYNPADARTKVAMAADEKDKLIRIQQRATELKSSNGAAQGGLQQEGPIWEFILYVTIALVLVFAVTGLGLWFLLRYF